MPTRDVMIEELRAAGENVAHNIGDKTLEEKYNNKFKLEAEDDDENDDAIVITNTDPEEEVTAGAATETPEPAVKKKRVIIHSNDRENDEKDMVVGHKGQLHRIQVGEEVEIDVELIGVINDAVEERNVSVIDKEGNPTGEIVVKPRKRYIVEPVGV